MSLSDALLLEPPRGSSEVWIAHRTDGQRGTGTIDDPFDGSTISTPTIVVTGITKGTTEPTKKTATAAAPNHGFSEGDVVTVFTPSITIANTADAYYTGTFQIHILDENNFEYTMAAEPGSAQAPAPLTCWRERERFDSVMRDVPAYTAVHLGPGIFETKGVAALGFVEGWEVKSGQTLCGSGIGVTTLKLVGASAPERHYWAIAATIYNYVENFEVSDLSVDCNVGGQPNSDVACGAVAVPGRHIRIRRIRVINWGSQTQTYVENFVVVSGAPHPNLYEAGQEGADCVIEDCTAEKPGANPVNNSSVIILSAGERSNDALMSYHRGCVVRNCYINGQIVYGTLVPLPIASISYDAVKDVPANNQFRYSMESNPGQDAASPTMQKVFGVGRISVDRNTIELATTSTGQLAIHVDDAALVGQSPDHVHRDVLIRQNKIRYTDAQFDPGFSGSGIEVNGAKHLIVSENVIECAPSNPLRNARCGAATYFHNTTPAGALIQGFNGTIKYSELETEAEDALVLALLSTG